MNYICFKERRKRIVGLGKTIFRELINNTENYKWSLQELLLVLSLHAAHMRTMLEVSSSENRFTARLPFRLPSTWKPF